MTGSAVLMDRIYRHQRHIYNLSRKYYLLGRDRMIAELKLVYNKTRQAAITKELSEIVSGAAAV